jgi:hypothetical protein
MPRFQEQNVSVLSSQVSLCYLILSSEVYCRILVRKDRSYVSYTEAEPSQKPLMDSFCAWKKQVSIPQEI